MGEIGRRICCWLTRAQSQVQTAVVWWSEPLVFLCRRQEKRQQVPFFAHSVWHIGVVVVRGVFAVFSYICTRCEGRNPSCELQGALAPRSGFQVRAQVGSE